ncbi:MAG: 23S rRNA (guanosine(2251)-2'-O)-methyltransferase RlmB [Flavobacteriales bacterium]|nr:23S rRNA (guanosine(2251)-2'-O)-methyltransferase RlmB [Flavobacteriales bacterium]
MKKNHNNSFETYGIHPVLEAIKANKKIDRVLIQQGLKGDSFKVLFDLIQERKIPFQMVPIQKLNKLTKNNHQGVFAYLSLIEYMETSDLIMKIDEEEKNPLILILDRVSDVRNIGAIARSAECAGAQGIIITAKGSARINSEAIKASAGALHRIPICKETNLKNVIKMLQTSDIRVVACTEKTESKMYDADFTQPTAIIMGSEGEGIHPAVLNACDDRVAIPMKGHTESLNVSVAAGIVLYEAVRQRI